MKYETLYGNLCLQVGEWAWWEAEEMQEEGEEEEGVASGGGEGTGLEQVQKKYQLFEEQCADILDPDRVSELELMKSLGLPTVLVNNYADMNEDDPPVCARRGRGKGRRKGEERGRGGGGGGGEERGEEGGGEEEVEVEGGGNERERRGGRRGGEEEGGEEEGGGNEGERRGREMRREGIVYGG